MINLIKKLILEQVSLISEMGLDDVNLKFIMNTYDNAVENKNEKVRKKIINIIFNKDNIEPSRLDNLFTKLLNKTKQTEKQILIKKLREMDYNEIKQIRNEITKELFIKEDYKTFVKQIILEKVTKTKVICDKCGWSWKLKDGGKDKYICHNILPSGRMCNHDNTPKNKTKKINKAR
jgi:hypothetical protein